MASNGVTLEEIVSLAVTQAMSTGVAEIRAELAALRNALPPQLGSVAAAAEALGVTTRTIHRLIRSGKIRARKVGRKTVIDLALLNATELS